MRSRAINLAWFSAILSPLCHCEAHSAVAIRRSESEYHAFMRSTQIAIYHLRQRRKYQASDIAKLRLEFLSLFELIACIGCAEQSNKPSVALGNTHTCVLPLPQRRFLLVSLRGTQCRGNLRGRNRVWVSHPMSFRGA